MSSRDASYLPRMERLVQLFRCSAVNPAGLSGRERAADGLDVRRESERSLQPAIRPCRFSQGNVSGGGRDQRGAALPLAPQMPPRPTNRLRRSVQPRGDRRARLTYANDMEMTQARGHADRFHFN
ncbi:hypothetical protein EYF80_002642 [Liparis tanakae]|uniref:Uncharacterized protein n=1 Tax=Liparis tanakae TaxID=230148 RepID=A0A4Z2JA18_9TELE|nr:hypothetical protein EYF80_002642 [Liparis tanakae]